MGQSFEPSGYKRIVSLVPSITQSLIDLGAGKYLVGITAFCPKPDGDNIMIVGGTKNPRMDRIVDLNPDLVLANKEENEKKFVEDLVGRFTTFVSYPRKITDNYNLIRDLVNLLGISRDDRVSKILLELKGLKEREQLNYKVFCPIWDDPYMSINRDTYINSVLRSLGFKNVTAEYDQRYPVVDLEKLDQVDIVILPSEPLEFKEHHEKFMRTFPALSSADYVYVDGRYMSWYGTLAVEAQERLRKTFKRYI